MLQNQSRRLLVKAFIESHNAAEVAKIFSIDKSGVYRLTRQMKKEGSVDLRTSLRGRKPLIPPNGLSQIDNLVHDNPDITLQEIKDKLQLSVSISTIDRAVIKMGYHLKKKSIHASEQERPRCGGKTQKMGSRYVREKCGSRHIS